MAVPYEKIVGEDLNTGHGSVSVTMPAGGTATGSLIGLHTFAGHTYNVLDFGAVGDGRSDDTAAINAALALSGAKCVYVPGGTYRLTAPLLVPSSTTLWLDPQAILQRAWSSGSTLGIIAAMVRNANWTSGDTDIAVIGGRYGLFSAGQNGYVFAFHKVTRLRITGAAVLDWTAPGGAFTLFDCNDVVCSDLYAKTTDQIASEDAFHVEGGSRITLNNFDFQTGDDCIALIQEAANGTTEATLDLTDVTISNGYCKSAVANGIRIQSAFGQSAVRAIRRITISNVNIVGGNANTDGGGIKISDDTASGKMTDFRLSNIHIDASLSTADCVKLFGLTRVHFAQVSVVSPYNAGFLVDGVFDATFTDCEVHTPRHAGADAFCAGTTAGNGNVNIIGGLYESAPGIGIHLGSATHAQVDCSVVNAVVRNCTGDGIKLDNANQGGRIFGNKVTNCAYGVNITATCVGVQLIDNDLLGNNTAPYIDLGSASWKRMNRASGATDAIGSGFAGLNFGTVTVTSSQLEAGAGFLITRMDFGNAGVGHLRVKDISPGFPGTFKIVSTDVTDNSTVYWEQIF